jgi:hypothetical protein
MQCFIGSLSFSATEDDLYKTFAGCDLNMQASGVTTIVFAIL